MEAVDVWCPFCDAGIGRPCLNPQGGPLGYSGSRAIAAAHKDRHRCLANVLSEWNNQGQGMLKATLRMEQSQIDRLTAEIADAYMRAVKTQLERELRSRRNRYQALWNLLDKENRPVVRPYKRPASKKDVAHPELIDCPKQGCTAQKGEKCVTMFGDYHVERIRKSP